MVLIFICINGVEANLWFSNQGIYSLNIGYNEPSYLVFIKSISVGLKKNQQA